jgi:hypothetical protein
MREPRMLMNPDQDAAGFDQDVRGLANGKIKIVSGSCADDGDYIDAGRDRHRDFSAGRAFHHRLSGRESDKRSTEQ